MVALVMQSNKRSPYRARLFLAVPSLKFLALKALSHGPSGHLVS